MLKDYIKYPIFDNVSWEITDLGEILQVVDQSPHICELLRIERRLDHSISALTHLPDDDEDVYLVDLFTKDGWAMRDYKGDRIAYEFDNREEAEAAFLRTGSLGR